MDKAKSGYETFSQATSLHGFSELYNAKTNFWRLFWFVIVTLSIGVTVYQISQTTNQFFNQGTFTVIEPVPTDRIRYPPIKLCFFHWMYWIDWDKAYSMNFTKQSLLYGMSFLTNVYSSERFDMNSAKKQFQNSMISNNMTKLTEFYKSVSKSVPRGYAGAKTISDISVLFNETEIIPSPYNQDVFLCYVASDSHVNNFIRKQKLTVANDFKLKTNSFTFNIFVQQMNMNRQEINPKEYQLNSFYWIKSKYFEDVYDDENVQESSFFTLPLGLFPEGYGSKMVPLKPDSLQYVISMKASVQKFKSTKENPCKQEFRSIVSKTALCLRQCNHGSQLYASRKTSCTPLFLVMRLKQTSDINNLCKNEIQFIGDDDNWKHLETSTVTNTKNLVQKNNTNSPEVVDLFLKCANNCDNYGCEKWNYEFSYETASLFSPLGDISRNVSKIYSIQIDYPLDGMVMEMTETDSQTWENFVGSVGGLLGIWTGASILSFIQMFYLCCCVHSSSRWCNLWYCNKKIFSGKNRYRISIIFNKHF